MESGPKRKSVRTRRVGLGAVVAAMLLTSACAAGQQAETAQEKTTLDGNNVDVGTMQLRGLALEAPVTNPYYPEGADVAVTVVMVNSAASTDQLTGISSSAFTSWSAYDTTAAADAVQAADDPLADSSSSASSSSSTSTSASPLSPSTSAATSAATSSAAPTGSQSVSVAPGSRVGFGTPEATGGLLLLKAKRAIYPGNTVRVTFTFAKAGSKSVLVPVQLTAGANASSIPAPAGSGSEG